MPAKVEAKRFTIGDEVMAKWPKSTLFYKGKIVDHNDIEYLVRFEESDGSELAVKFKDVSHLQTINRSRSRSRGRTPTRKSLSRKSPSRKSPSRKSPAKKSPARKASPVKRSSRSSRPSIVETNANSKPVKKEITKVETETISPPTTRNRSNAQPIRQSARIAKNEATKVITNSNNIKVDVRTVTQAVESQNQFLSYLRRAGNCYMASIKALPMALFVCFAAFILNQMCTKNKCTIKEFPDIPLKLNFYYDPKVINLTVGFIGALLLMSFIPIGKVVKARSGANVRCNGFLSLLACFVLVPVLLKFEYRLSSLYLLFRHFLVTFECLGIVLAVALYIKSRYAKKDEVNPNANSGYLIPDFVEGREIFPRIGNLDIKFFLFRVALITMVMVNIIIAIKDLQARAGDYSPTLLLACALHIFYCVDLIWFEDSYFTTYEYMKQGTGLIVCAGYTSMPFFVAIFSRYVFNHRHELPWYCLVGIAGFNLIGYIILRGSSSQKHAFRTNPNDPALAHLESMPTSAGQRLLSSGWWGLVRHPNYLGDILVQLSWALICGFHHAVPWLVTFLSVCYLIGRTFQVETQCKKKYGLAWSSYTNRVPYKIIPKVF